jgi:hypothetical protein
MSCSGFCLAVALVIDLDLSCPSRHVLVHFPLTRFSDSDEPVPLLMLVSGNWTLLPCSACIPASSLLVAYSPGPANTLADSITFAHRGGKLSKKESARRHYVEHSKSIRQKARQRAAW